MPIDENPELGKGAAGGGAVSVSGMSLAGGRAPRKTAGNRLSGLLEAEEEDEFYQTTYGGFTEARAGPRKRERGRREGKNPGQRGRGRGLRKALKDTLLARWRSWERLCVCVCLCNWEEEEESKD